jgi:F-type H+-transporting ATPase subunit gamma
MPSTREIRGRIKSVKSTAQITRAMEMVSAVKMRRAQAATLASRPYSERMARLVGVLAAHTDAEENPLLRRRPIQRSGLLLITSDRGLAGSLNVNVVRQAATYLVDHTEPVSVVTIGRKGREWMVRHGADVIAEVSQIGDKPGLIDIAPIARIVIDQYSDKSLDAVDLVYSQFVSTTVQRAVRKRLLPVEPERETGRHFSDFLFEPNPSRVLHELLPRYVEVLIYQALLESLASEHSARMVAMHAATQNARDVIQELTLAYNKMRQTSITNEILEISSGAEALAGG